MDPNQALANMVSEAKTILAEKGHSNAARQLAKDTLYLCADTRCHNAKELAKLARRAPKTSDLGEAIHALNGWIARQGFLPMAWTK